MGLLESVNAFITSATERLKVEQEKIEIYKPDYMEMSNSELMEEYRKYKAKKESFWCTQEQEYRFKAILQVMRERQNSN